MKKIILSLLTVFAVTAVQAQTMGAKIVGGTEATRGEFPFIVSIRTTAGDHFCGGSLIRKNWVLTAGHCAEYARQGVVAIGLHDLRDITTAEIMRPKSVITHPNFNEYTMENDFALIELERDSAYAPVEMNSNEIAIPETGETLMSTTTGWGVLDENDSNVSNLLQKVEVPLISQTACNQYYHDEIHDSMICAGFQAGGKDSCQGDSGGPLLTKTATGENLLIGVVSWGYGCARPNNPGVYSKVNAGLTWIQSTAK